jgi:pseudaminic acid synthase
MCQITTLQIGSRSIGPGHPVYVIAELSANHGGVLDIALRSVDAIADTGADAVKVQTYTADSMTLDSDDPAFRTRADSLWAGNRLYDLYSEGTLPLEWHQAIADRARHRGIDFFSSPFDPATVDFLETLEVPAYKIASLEIVDIPLIRAAAATGKPVILSTGIASEADIRLALETCHRENNRQVAVLQCTTQYPTAPDQVNLRSIPWLQDTFGVVAGLSDHSMGSTAALAAVSLGCAIVEKHFILDKSLGTLDDRFSMDPGEFTRLVDCLREAETMLGEAGYHLTDRRQSARRTARSLIAIRDIAAGETFGANNVRSLRPNIGLPPVYLDQLLGMIAGRDIRRGEGISADCFEPDDRATLGLNKSTHP